MTDAVGGAAVTGDERREDWHCPHCGTVHGYTYRRSGITRLRITALSAEAEWTGDGGYGCPSCGTWVTWTAGLKAYRRLMDHYAATR